MLPWVDIVTNKKKKAFNQNICPHFVAEEIKVPVFAQSNKIE